MNHYETLGVSSLAEDVVIRAAYRALAQRYHPDKTNEPLAQATLRMRAITQAYQVLSDPVSRTAYDASLQMDQEDALVFASRTPHSIANLEANAWEILLRLHPELGSNLSKLETKEMHLAKTYRSLLLELISEKLVSQLVESICTEMKEIQPEAVLSHSRHKSRKQAK
jgi:hypothetical protein